MKHLRYWLCAALPAIVSGMPLVAAAQEEADAGEASYEIIWEVVVTARRREDSLQEVPLSVSAVTAEQIEKRGLRDLQDIAQETSGLVYENYATAGLSTAAVIRGMGQTFTTARIQNTAVFFDNIYLQRQSMINPGLMDLERVEVVKGPQNSQFGRNAFSGVVHYVSKKPTEDTAGKIVATYGSGSRLDLRGSLSGPLVEGKLYGRVAASLSEFDGHTDNDHPFADDGPGGSRDTNDRLGGWDDQFYSASLTWTPTDRWEIGGAFHRTESVREPQAFYDLNGARYAYDSGESAGPPTFAFTAPFAANCLDTRTYSRQVPFPVQGFHAWCGKLPKLPPVLDDARLEAAGFGDAKGQIVVDPRSSALDSETNIAQFNLAYDFNDTLSLAYRFGYVDHEADTNGTAEGRASLVGSEVAYAPVRELSEPPFFQLLGFPGSFGSVAYTTAFNRTPIEELEASSHELRLAWSGEAVTARAGLYRSSNEDQDGSTFHFVPPCDGPANCGVALPNAPNALEGLYITVARVAPGVNVGVPHPLTAGHAVFGNHATYEDKVTALFGDVEWDIADRLTLALEARYSWEKKSFEQFSTTFGGTIPDNVEASKEETFRFFTPRAIVEWRPTDTNMLYALVAKGAKTGGFNAVDPMQNPEQAVFDKEGNLTFEIGTKNRFFDDSFTLNAAFYLIDWQDVQGSEAATSDDAWTIDVVGNIGDAEVLGFEIDGLWQATDNFFIDYNFAYSNAEYKDAIYLSGMAGRNSSWGCNDTVCRADGRVDGSQVEKTSKFQYNVGLNYFGNIAADWNLGARFDFNYRSRMYATPMNLAHNGGRTLANANVSLSDDNWSLTLWSRNVFDKKYVANSFVLPSFSRYIVGLGARRTIGLTLEYAL